MDSLEITNRSGNRNTPARVRITHENRVLSPATRFALMVVPDNKQGLAYPAVVIDESPPVNCFLYDWLQYVNFKLQREAQNITTAKEQQLKTLQAFDVYPRSQASFCSIVSAAWEPDYTTEAAQTEELYLLLDDLINQPAVEFEPQDLVTAFRVTAGGSQRITRTGDTRVSVVNTEQLIAQLPTILPVAA